MSRRTLLSLVDSHHTLSIFINSHQFSSLIITYHHLSSVARGSPNFRCPASAKPLPLLNLMTIWFCCCLICEIVCLSWTTDLIINVNTTDGWWRNRDCELWMNRDCAFHRYFYFFNHVGIPIPFFFEIPLFHSPHFSSLLIASHHFSSLLITSHHAQSIRNHAQSIFTTPYRFHQFSSLPIKNQL